MGFAKAAVAKVDKSKIKEQKLKLQIKNQNYYPALSGLVWIAVLLYGYFATEEKEIIRGIREILIILLSVIILIADEKAAMESCFETKGK